MLRGLLFGLMTAVMYGTSDVLLVYASRRIGTARSVVVGLALSVAILLTYALFTSLRLPDDPNWMVRSAVIGAANGLSYLLFVQALRLGPVVVVSPISASLGVMTVVLAVVFFGESLTLPQVGAIAVTVVGSFLAAVVVERDTRRPQVVGRGPLFMILGIMLYAGYTVSLRDPVREYGWEPTLVIARIAALAIAATVGFLVIRREERPLLAAEDAAIAGAEKARRTAGRFGLLRHPLAGPVMVLFCVGVLTTLGIITYSIGLQEAPAWLVGLAVATSPVIVIGSGLIFLKEKLRPTQWLGVALIGVGLLLIAVA